MNKINIVIKKKQYRIKNRVQINKMNRKYSKSPEGIYTGLKSNAKIRNINFNITQKDFVEWYNKQDKVCVYCNRTEEKIIQDSNKQFSRLSIDRKDNDFGYTLDNITLCCFKCNTIKGDVFTFNEMIEIGNRYLIFKNN